MGEGLPAKFPQRSDLWVGRFRLIREVQQMPRDLFESVLDLKNASFFCALPAVSRVGNRQSGRPKKCLTERRWAAQNLLWGADANLEGLTI
jgi:hypothetical protein